MRYSDSAPLVLLVMLTIHVKLRGQEDQGDGVAHVERVGFLYTSTSLYL